MTHTDGHVLSRINVHARNIIFKLRVLELVEVAAKLGSDGEGADVDLGSEGYQETLKPSTNSFCQMAVRRMYSASETLSGRRAGPLVVALSRSPCNALWAHVVCLLPCGQDRNE